MQCSMQLIYNVFKDDVTVFSKKKIVADTNFFLVFQIKTVYCC